MDTEGTTTETEPEVTQAIPDSLSASASTSAIPPVAVPDPLRRPEIASEQIVLDNLDDNMSQSSDDEQSRPHSDHEDKPKETNEDEANKPNQHVVSKTGSTKTSTGIGGWEQRVVEALRARVKGKDANQPQGS